MKKNHPPDSSRFCAAVQKDQCRWSESGADKNVRFGLRKYKSICKKYFFLFQYLYFDYFILHV